MKDMLNKIIRDLNKLKVDSITGIRGGEYRIGLTNAIQVVTGNLYETMEEQPETVNKTVVFSAKMIKDGEVVTSKSIINEHGKVFLKHPIHKGHWIECYVDSLSYSLNSKPE